MSLTTRLTSLFRGPQPEAKRGLDWPNYLTFQGSAYPYGWGSQVQTTYGKNPAEPIASDFEGYCRGALFANGIVSAVELVRLSVFAEARFQFQELRSGQPGRLFGDRTLELLEHPWPGGTTGDLLARMILHADMAGNAYVANLDSELVCLRPDWVDIILAPRRLPYGSGGADTTVGHTRAGYAYYEGGKLLNKNPAYFPADEVAHFAPYPDPLATFRGMSWLSPVVREIQADIQATTHKQKFFENAATPNLHIAMKQEMTPDQFAEFVELTNKGHQGAENAYKTLFTAGGADVTVVGADMRQLDFKNTQGAGETRISNAAGIHSVVIGLSEGLAGSSLNAGNYSAAKRSTVDRTFRPLWRNVSGSLEMLVQPPTTFGPSRLWVDTSDVAFLRDDERDLADIRSKEAQIIRTLGDAGYEAESVKAAVIAGDWSLLVHSGLYSVQLVPPGSDQPATAPAA